MYCGGFELPPLTRHRARRPAADADVDGEHDHFGVSLMINLLTGLRLGTHNFKDLGIDVTGNATNLYMQTLLLSSTATPSTTTLA